MMKLFALVALCVSAISLCFVLYTLALPHLAKFRPFEDWTFYDLGLYGAYPVQVFTSVTLQSPRVNVIRCDDRCDPGLTFLTPRGISNSAPGPTILDAVGNLVWTEPKWGETTDLKVQQYQGRDYLTFWAGDADQGRGKGFYYMLDSSYSVVYKLSPSGDGLRGDLHEFKLTETGTALMTIYDIVSTDLSSVNGPSDGWVYDCLFQEVDVATGKLVFEWRATEHYRINETLAPRGSAGRTKDDLFDFFHLNSVDKDHEGNYYISSRYMCSIACIGPSGDILWKLGGRSNDFADLSSGAATNFSWQHDARWHPNNTITLFDNAAYNFQIQNAEYSRGLLIDLDIVMMTATLRQSYAKPRQFRSASQGSMQQLSSTGNVLIGWGQSAAYTEFAADGEILCDYHFGASSVFGFGRITSYRAYKGGWTGQPTAPPDIKMSGDSVFVSWNGATGVTAWELQGARIAVEDGENHKFNFKRIKRTMRNGSFETRFSLAGGNANVYLRVVALDSAGIVLGITDVIDRRTRQRAATWPVPPLVEEQPHNSLFSWVFLAVCIVTAVGFSVRGCWTPLPYKLQRHWQWRNKPMSSLEYGPCP